MATPHITLTRRVGLISTGGGYRMRIWVSEVTDDIPPCIFVYQKYPAVPLDEELTDIFVHIASYADVEDYPEGAPDDTGPFYRRYYADMAFESRFILEQKWNMIKIMVKHTVEDYVRLNNLPPAEIQEETIEDG